MVASPSPAVKALNDQSPAFVTIPISRVSAASGNKVQFSLLFTTPNHLLNRDIYVCDGDRSKLNIFPSVFMSGLLGVLWILSFRKAFIQICFILILFQINLTSPNYKL